MKFIYPAPLLLVVAFVSHGRGAEPTFTVTNKTTPAFTVTNKTAPVAPKDQFRDTSGVLYERGADGHYRAVPDQPAPEVATPKTGGTFPASGGCGCTQGANCGAPFCKSRGGTGCPQTCPVKGNK